MYGNKSLEMSRDWSTKSIVYMSGRRVSEVDVCHCIGGGVMPGEMSTCYVNISFTETKKNSFRFVSFAFVQILLISLCFRLFCNVYRPIVLHGTRFVSPFIPMNNVGCNEELSIVIGRRLNKVK